MLLLSVGMHTDHSAAADPRTMRSAERTHWELRQRRSDSPDTTTIRPLNGDDGSLPCTGALQAASSLSHEHQSYDSDASGLDRDRKDTIDAAVDLAEKDMRRWNPMVVDAPLLGLGVWSLDLDGSLWCQRQTRYSVRNSTCGGGAAVGGWDRLDS